jgi:hypothetical protein
MAKIPVSNLVGFISLRDLMLNNYTPKELIDAGVPKEKIVLEIIESNFNREKPPLGIKLTDLLDAGVPEVDLKHIGYNEQDIAREKEQIEMFKRLERQRLERQNK